MKAISDVETVIKDSEEILMSTKEINIDELIAAGNYKEICRCLDCINKLTLSAVENISKLTIEEVKIDQQISAIEEREENPESDEITRKYHENFNKNFADFLQANELIQNISGLQIIGDDRMVEITFKDIHKVKILFSEGGWKKVLNIQVISGMDAELKRFGEICQECIDEDDLIPLWTYIRDHLN